MKHLLFIIFVMYSMISFCQDFEYSTPSKHNSVRVKATNETFSLKGKKQIEATFEDGYWEKMLGNVHKLYLSDEQLVLLQNKRLVVIVTIDYEGNIQTVSFMMTNGLLKEIPEEVLRNLYKAYRKVRLDMNQGDFYGQLNKNTYLRYYYRLR